MSHQIIKQPDGKFCVWSSVVNGLVVTDATAEDLANHYAEIAAEDTRRRTLEICRDVVAGEARKVYYQFVKTYEEVAGK